MNKPIKHSHLSTSEPVIISINLFPNRRNFLRTNRRAENWKLFTVAVDCLRSLAEFGQEIIISANFRVTFLKPIWKNTYKKLARDTWSRTSALNRARGPHRRELFISPKQKKPRASGSSQHFKSNKIRQDLHCKLSSYY